jgi:nitronate monooxygenase
MSDPKDPLACLAERLSLPLIAAPMFLVSRVDLEVAACGVGLLVRSPPLNCRNAEQLDSWLFEIDARLRRRADEAGVACAPSCPNLIVHRSNAPQADDPRIVLNHAPELVVTSVGSPRAVIAPLHDAGALVFADVASVRHAERAVDAGADGLVLLTAGAGGQTGWLNPFAFTRAVRRFFQARSFSLAA